MTSYLELHPGWKSVPDELWLLLVTFLLSRGQRPRTQEDYFYIPDRRGDHKAQIGVFGEQGIGIAIATVAQIKKITIE